MAGIRNRQPEKAFAGKPARLPVTDWQP